MSWSSKSGESTDNRIVLTWITNVRVSLCLLITYSQEILHSDPNKSQFHVCFGGDFLDVSKSIDAGQNLQRAINNAAAENRHKRSQNSGHHLPAAWSDPTEIWQNVFYTGWKPEHHTPARWAGRHVAGSASSGWYWTHLKQTDNREKAIFNPNMSSI